MTHEEDALGEKLRQVARQRQAAEDEGADRRYQDASRKRLLKIVKKKNTTTFIGAIAKFEQHVGVHLWGHGRPEGECTPEQLAWRDIWEVCRTEILNHGNNQQRALENELGQYTVVWDRHTAVLPVIDRPGGA